ncbi:Uncharacterised protein [uncultured archaeon]|nr:Uncharacterised protein [uncultured archaeon]
MQSGITGNWNENLENIERDLSDLGEKCGAKKYYSGAARKSFAVFFGAWLLWLLFADGIIEGALVSIAAAAAAMALLISLPGMKLKARAGRIEKHLPFALMQLNAELDAGVDFERALLGVSGSHGEFPDGIKKCIEDSRLCKMPLQDCLLRFAGRNRSLQLKRAVSQLISVYEQGH